MSGRLEGRVAWVTGAGRGLGRAIALAFAEEGADLLLSARSEGELAEVATAVRARGRRAEVALADVRSREAVGRARALGEERFGRLDVLVNNAGVWRMKALLEFSEAEWEETLGTNVTGLFHCSRAVLPGMRARRSGRIVNVASIDGQHGFENLVPQCTSKAAAIGFTKALAKELWRDGIAVTALCPAEVDKSVAWGEEPKERPGAPSVKVLPADVARAAVYLASADAAAVTGVTLDVYGIGFLAS